MPCPPRSRARASTPGTSGRSRSAPTRSRSSPGSASPCGSRAAAGSSAGRGRRRPGDRLLGGPVRDRRRAALPRVLDARPVLGPERRPRPRAVRVGGRPRHLGRGRARCRRRVHRVPAPARELPGVRGRARPRPAARAGRRSPRQLVQPGAVRLAHDAAVGPAGRRLGRRGGRLPAGHAVPPDLPLRDGLEHRRCPAPDLPGPSVPARSWSGILALRLRLHARSGVDRDAAHRRGRARPRSPAERLDLDPGRCRCVGSVYRCRASPPGREETVSLDAPGEAPATETTEPVEESTDAADPEKTADSDDSEESEQADAARPDPGR